MGELLLPAAEAGPDRPTLPIAPDDDDDDPDVVDQGWRYRREFAAVAMDNAARDPRLARAVRGQLRRWRRDGDAALRWTAAYALKFDVGARNAQAALEELRVLGTPQEANRYEKLDLSARRWEWAVFHAAGAGLAGMFVMGAHSEVLDQLAEWWRHPRWSVRLLVLQAVIFVMGLTVAKVGRPERSPDEGPTAELFDEDDRRTRARWPVLVALHDRDGELQRRGAELVRAALRSKERQVAMETLAQWFEDGADDDGLLAAVEAFLPLLVKEESDRGRLRGLVRAMRHRWEDPLPDPVADRLEKAITEIPVIGGRKVLA
jgi:hypothetical protein